MITNIETIDLKNIGIIKGKVSDDVMAVLRKEIEDIQADWSSGNPWNQQLAGHIKKEFLLSKSNKVIEPFLVQMATEHNRHYNYIDPNFDLGITQDKKYSFALESLWVNFQERYEFNPIHRHAGFYSFVIWVDVPYFLNFEQNVSPGKNSNANKSGAFEFVYTDILGDIRGQIVPADRTYHADICMFPAKLHHTVHPFYSTDKLRVSVAGNLKVTFN